MKVILKFFISQFHTSKIHLALQARNNKKHGSKARNRICGRGRVGGHSNAINRRCGPGW